MGGLEADMVDLKDTVLVACSNLRTRANGTGGAHFLQLADYVIY